MMSGRYFACDDPDFGFVVVNSTTNFIVKSANQFDNISDAEDAAWEMNDKESDE